MPSFAAKYKNLFAGIFILFLDLTHKIYFSAGSAWEKIQYFLSFLLVLLLVSAPNLASGEEKRPVRVGIFQNYPIVFQDDQGIPRGIYVDLLKKMAETENWELQFVPCKWKNCLLNLRTGRIDLMSNITYVKERDQYMDFSNENVLMMWGQVYARPELKVQNILDMEGLKVAILKGGVNAINFKKLCEKFNVNCQFLPVDTQKEVFEAVSSGKTDAGVLNNVFGTAHEKDYGVKLSPILFNPFSLLFAAPEGKNRDLLETVDRHLAKWKENENSFYHGVLKKWYGARKTEKSLIPDWILYFMAAAGLSVLLLFLWSRTLRHQVKIRTRELKETNESLVREMEERHLAEEDRKKLETQLQQARKMESIGTLAGGIAHDFNNILASVIGYTELSLDQADKGSVMADNLQEVYVAGLRARDLVKQILGFARQGNEEIYPVKVRTLTEEAMKLLRSTIPSTIEIRQFLKSDAYVMANPVQIHQIIMNLGTNGAQAMDAEGGILEINLKDRSPDKRFTRTHKNLKAGNYVELTISDTGVGIAPDIIDSIFDPYFTTKIRGDGTGMGLSTVHQLVNRYGGEILVESQVERGATFTLLLPVTEERFREKPYTHRKLPTGSERILLVDDELPIAQMGKQVLESLGYRVTTRTDSREALELFSSRLGDFDLVITDTTMPHMTGDRLAQEIMALKPGTPVILCTGYSKKISREKALEMGIKAFIFKPIVKDELAKTVRTVLDDS